MCIYYVSVIINKKHETMKNCIIVTADKSWYIYTYTHTNMHQTNTNNEYLLEN